MIKFTCANNHNFELTEQELQKEKALTHCPYCGEKLKIENMSEILDKDIQKQVEIYVTRAFKELGLEGTIEAIEYLQNKRTKEYYQAELRKRGFNI